MSIRVLTIGLLVTALAWAQPGSGRGKGGPEAHFLGAEAGMPGPVVKGAPYSADAITETVQMLPDGNRIRQTNTVHVDRDSDGRTRREQSLSGIGGMGAADLPSVVFINDPVSGVNYALNPRDRAATKTVWEQGGRNPGRGEPGRDMGRGPAMVRMERVHGPNVKTESLGKQLFDGVPADGTRTTLTIPAGEIGNEQPIQIVSESWYSPDLHTIVMSRRTDPRNGETTFRLSNLTRAEPPRTLFELPADFKVTESYRGRGGSKRN